MTRLVDKNGREIKEGDTVTCCVRWISGDGYDVTAPVIERDGELQLGKGTHVTHYAGLPDKTTIEWPGATPAWGMFEVVEAAA